jgi:NADH dehydrogenase
MIKKTAVVFGGTGFIGKQIVKRLADLGMQIKVATRVPESAYELKPLGDVGQIVPVACNYSDYDSIARLIDGSQIVVNCVGILYEKHAGDFMRIHADVPESIAAACAVAKVGQFVHLSALGVDHSPSLYAASKLAGEARILKAFPAATIMRPSVVFGEDDDFFNKFAALAGFLPALPLIGGGHTRFQPVYVGDVADAIVTALTLSHVGKNSPAGRIYELGGPEILSFKEIYQKLFSYTKQKRALMPLPFWLAALQAKILSLLPVPLLTEDQVESLKADSVVSGNEATLEDLKIVPTALDMILPNYLVNYKAGGRFAGI